MHISLGVRGLAQRELVAHYSIFRVFRLLSPLQGFSAEGHGSMSLYAAFLLDEARYFALQSCECSAVAVQCCGEGGPRFGWSMIRICANC